MAFDWGAFKLIPALVGAVKAVLTGWKVRSSGPFEVSASHASQLLAYLPRSDGEYQGFYNHGVDVVVKNWTDKPQLIRGFALEQSAEIVGNSLRISKSIELKPGGFHKELLFFGVRPSEPASLVVFYDVAKNFKYPIQFTSSPD